MADIDNKKITFLISTLGGGGAEGVCVNLANALAECGWAVTLVVLHMNNAVFHDRLSDKVELVVLGINHARYAFGGLRRFLTGYQPEKVLVFNYELAVLLVAVRVLTRQKFKIIARNVNTLSHNRRLSKGFWHKQIVNRLVDELYCKVDHVINQCEGMREDLIMLYPGLADRSSVIYNPVNQMVADTAKRINSSSVQKEDYLLCVGRLEPQKAFHYAIEAFAKIELTYPNLRLKIVGTGSLEADLKTLAKRLGIIGRVDFEGFKKDMIPYYLKARATVLTSLYEGFPNVLVESITLGTPVVAFDCPSGPREIIQQGVNGVLVNYQDHTHLVLSLHFVLTKSFNTEIVSATSNSYSINHILDQYIRSIALSTV